MEGGLSELAHHASAARLTASAMRAQLSALRTGGNTFSPPATERPSPYPGGEGDLRSLGRVGGEGEDAPTARLFMFTPARALRAGRDRNEGGGEDGAEQATPEVHRPSSSSRQNGNQGQVSCRA